jgi:hypothetical protein
VDPKLYQAKQHLFKYQQALLGMLGEITGKSVEARSVFEPAVSYTDGWESVGTLALSIWGLAAFQSERFDRHPQWESAANETIRFLSVHCANCGAKHPGGQRRFLCSDCAGILDSTARRRITETAVAEQVAAYFEELHGPFDTEDDPAE